jgi:molecular chaperone GrpE
MTDPTSGTDRTDMPGPAPDGEPSRHAGAGGGPADGLSDPGQDLSPAEQIEQLRKERDDYREQALRSRADFANYQKRAKQQADSDRAYAVGSLAKDLLDPLDNLARAVDALRSSCVEGITAGLDMVQKQLHDVLAKHGVEPIRALGTPFDPNYHDALLQQPTADQPEGMVVGELSKGYKIRDRVLRPSKVAVSSRPSSG